jgi:predicted aldo/keto reductase-like oxidoreductase
MRKRALGKTGLMVTQIGFGGIKLDALDPSVASASLKRALDLGVNFIDTARNYRSSEAKIGAALTGRRHEYCLATKSGKRDAAGLLAELDVSLRELQTDVIDLYQLHTVSDRETYNRVMAPGGALDGAKTARQQGKVRFIGITCHRDTAVMRDAIESGEFESIMVAHNLLDPESIEASGVLDLARQHGMAVIVMKALAGGALHSPAPAGQRVKDDPIVRRILRHLLRYDAITAVIPGITCVAEIEENAATGEMADPIDDAEVAQLLRDIGALGKELRYGQRCLRCGYCQPCPQGLVIPEVFRAADMYQGYGQALKHMGVELYASLDPKPNVCTECGRCKAKCPAGLDIPAKLKDVARLFEAVSG